MPQELKFHIRGLRTNSNFASESPDGSLVIADNVVINKKSIVESRRGLNNLPFTLPLANDRANKLGQYAGKLLVHYNTGGLAYYDSSTGVNTFSGTYNSPDATSAKMKFAEAQQNLYFTSSSGIKRLDALSNTPTFAGMYKGLDCQATLSANIAGFFGTNAEVAYRVVWGITDANQNLIVGFPSQRATIANSTYTAHTFGAISGNNITITGHGWVTGTAGQVSTTGALPTPLVVATNYFVIVVDANTIKLASTLANALAGTPITLGGSPSGTNTFTPNASSDVSLQITIPSGVTVSHFFQIYRSNQSASSTTTPDDNMQLVYTANPTSGQISAGSVTVVDSTPDSLRGAALYTNDSQQGILQANELPPYALDLAVFRNCLFFGNTKTKMRLNLTVLAIGGSIGIAATDTLTIAGTTYTADTVENAATGHFQVVTSGSAAQNINDTCLSLIRVINQYATNTGVYAYYMSGPSDLPGRIMIEERLLGGPAFTAVASAHGSAYFPALPTGGTTVASTNTINLNGLMYSKQQIPDAVPSLNIQYCGSASKAILRIVALRDSLFILKEDGVYRCTGTSPANFSVDLLDPTAILVAPETVATLNNKIYCLTTQGVVAISDSGVEIISIYIDDQIQPLFGTPLAATKAYSFGVGYESYKKYILWTVSGSGDTYSTQQFVYDTVVQEWTRWTRSQSHAIVLTADDTMYATAPLSNNLVQERKTLVRNNDYCDESLSVNIVSVSGARVTVDSVANIVVGDSLWQSDGVTSVVTAVDPLALVVTVTDTLTWAISATTIFKSIGCLVEWAPSFAQNAGMLKHWSETELLLKINYFYTASLNWYSDLSPAIEKQAFSGIGSGGWGSFVWGASVWGATASAVPFRTYVPVEKQRCDLLSAQFSCRNARGNFQLAGIAHKVENVSERVSR